MRVSKKQIIDVIGDYLLNELIPKMHRDRGMQIALTVAVKTAQTNNALIDKLFCSPVFQAMLPPDEKGLIEIGRLLDDLEAATKKSGELPLTLPAIPLLAPTGGVITLYPEDIAAIRAKIGGENGNA